MTGDVSVHLAVTEVGRSSDRSTHVTHVKNTRSTVNHDHSPLTIHAHTQDKAYGAGRREGAELPAPQPTRGAAHRELLLSEIYLGECGV